MKTPPTTSNGDNALLIIANLQSNLKQIKIEIPNPKIASINIDIVSVVSPFKLSMSSIRMFTSTPEVLSL